MWLEKDADAAEQVIGHFGQVVGTNAPRDSIHVEEGGVCFGVPEPLLLIPQRPDAHCDQSDVGHEFPSSRAKLVQHCFTQILGPRDGGLGDADEEDPIQQVEAVRIVQACTMNLPSLS